jgi:hypothetical protein
MYRCPGCLSNQIRRRSTGIFRHPYHSRNQFRHYDLVLYLHWIIGGLWQLEQMDPVHRDWYAWCQLLFCDMLIIQLPVGRLNLDGWESLKLVNGNLPSLSTCWDTSHTELLWSFTLLSSLDSPGIQPRPKKLGRSWIGERSPPSIMNRLRC